MVKKTSTGLVICIALICFAYLIICLVYKPIILNDGIHSYISLHNYVNGGGWNKQLVFNNNASKLNVQNITWWAPGPYEIPYLTAKLFNCSIGIAICILSFISIAGGCFVYYKIFEKSSLSKNTILASLLILLLQRFMNINFILYSSSDLFLFLYVPLYIYTYLKVKALGKYYWLNLIVLVVLNLLGLFTKNSFLLFSTAFNIYLVVDFAFEHYRFKKFTTRYLIKKSIIIIPYFASVILFYLFYLRLGTNPTAGQGLLVNVYTILFGAFSGFCGVLFSALSIDSFYGNVQTKLTFLDPYQNIIMLAFLLVVFFLAYQYRKNIKTLFKTDGMFRITSIISLMYVLYWMVFTLKRSYISNEDRLFLPINIFVLPYLIDYVLKANRFIKYSAFIVIFISVIYGIDSMYSRVKSYTNDNVSAMSNDKDLKGFKLFIHEKADPNELSKISGIISSNYQKEKILTPDPDALFLLSIKNQYIFAPVNEIPASINDHQQYLLLINKTHKTSLKRWKPVYAGDNYNLYLSN